MQTKSGSELFKDELIKQLDKISGKPLHSPKRSVNKAVARALIKVFCTLPPRSITAPRAAYFSAEFLPGSFTLSSLAALELLKVCKKTLGEKGFDFSLLHQLSDPALGNGGLGRLAACLLDSAAATDIPLDGYGIRYKYGIFRQKINGFEQTEQPDIWQGDLPFEKENRNEAVTVSFGDGELLAVPFDVPIVGKNRVNRLRLWSAEAKTPVDMPAFLKGDISAAFKRDNMAESISGFLYPPDDTTEGKELRLKQQYFFSSASVQSIINDFKKTAKQVTELSDFIKIQLNDTHPTVAIPEMLRILITDFGLNFETAFNILGKIFSYTNHTVMAEALECWDESLFCRVLPRVYPYVVMLNNHLHRTINNPALASNLSIINDGKINMANMAVFVSHKVNGVAKIHSDIIKEKVFKNWHTLYPERFINITNGISPRMWLSVSNPALADFVDEKIGPDWRQDLSLIEQIKAFDSNNDLDELIKIKHQNKVILSNYLKQSMGASVDPEFMFTAQIKRIHEYKRQLLNILAVLGLYIDLKSGALNDFYPTAFMFSGKAAPGYYNAKQIIKLIGAAAKLIERDETARKYLKVIFIPDYNVKNAMKIIPAADLSEQLSTAGTEASGTGNMKLALNGAPTIGTMDGANIEIVGYAGQDNNYIFGANSDEIEKLTHYDPMDIYYTNDRISRVVDLLKDGPMGDFEVLFKSLLFGNDYENADRYKVLLDYPSYFDARLRANDDYKNSREYAKKCLNNIAAAGHFSADRAVKEYSKNIWFK